MFWTMTLWVMMKSCSAVVNSVCVCFRNFRTYGRRMTKWRWWRSPDREREDDTRKVSVMIQWKKMSCLILYVGVEPQWMLPWVCILLTLTYIRPLGRPLLYLIDHPIGTSVVFVIEFVSKYPTVYLLCLVSSDRNRKWRTYREKVQNYYIQPEK